MGGRYLINEVNCNKLFQIVKSTCGFFEIKNAKNRYFLYISVNLAGRGALLGKPSMAQPFADFRSTVKLFFVFGMAIPPTFN